MEMLQEIFAQALISGKIQIAFHSGELAITDVLEGICYQTLTKIKAIIQDDSLKDEACFMQIEEIVCALEEVGIDCGIRHDFG